MNHPGYAGIRRGDTPCGRILVMRMHNLVKTIRGPSSATLPAVLLAHTAGKREPTPELSNPLPTKT